MTVYRTYDIRVMARAVTVDQFPDVDRFLDGLYDAIPGEWYADPRDAGEFTLTPWPFYPLGDAPAEFDNDRAVFAEMQYHVGHQLEIDPVDLDEDPDNPTVDRYQLTCDTCQRVIAVYARP